MTFSDITKTMLGSMDFFELRRTAARYAVPFQGVRRQKLVKDIERKILERAQPSVRVSDVRAAQSKSATRAATSPVGAVSAKPKLESTMQKKVAARINTFSARSSLSRVTTR